ncbi:MAG: ActD-like protein [Kofleriaceae bacterium]|nr:ActD-like protein [Kofleriaceae bacterium]
MTTLPDWLVERIALDEVPAASKSRVDRADANDIAARVAAVRADNEAELAAYPPGPAIAQIEARIARAKQRRRVRRLGLLGLTTAAAAAIVLVVGTRHVSTDRAGGSLGSSDADVTRVKGATRLSAFRQAGDKVEKLDEDALVKGGDLIQLRYNAGGRPFGVIASVDGAGVVTLHHPVSEDAPPEATALAPKTTSLPNAYSLDDAPEFERFFFITADHPIDVKGSLEALRAFARRTDSASASLDLPADMHQSSLRLRKPSTRKPTP